MDEKDNVAPSDLVKDNAETSSEIDVTDSTEAIKAIAEETLVTKTEMANETAAFENEPNTESSSEKSSEIAAEEDSKNNEGENEDSAIYSLFEEETKSQDELKAETDVSSKPYDPNAPRKIDARFDFIELFIFTLAIVLFVTSFIIRHSIVVGSSMENTLFEGERLLISDLFYSPDYGDIIVFEDYSTNIKGAVVKRVIGLPGDRILITKDGSVYRNGELLIEEYVFIDSPDYQYEFLYVTVPENELFVMGDHRNNSDDSRSFGTIDEDSVLGKVLLRFYPFDRFGRVD